MRTISLVIPSLPAGPLRPIGKSRRVGRVLEG